MKRKPMKPDLTMYKSGGGRRPGMFSDQKNLKRRINWVTGGSKNANFKEIGEDDGSR